MMQLTTSGSLLQKIYFKISACVPLTGLESAIGFAVWTISGPLVYNLMLKILFNITAIMEVTLNRLNLLGTGGDIHRCLVGAQVSAG